MKRKQFLALILISFLTLVLLHNAFAQDYTTLNLPEGAKARLGKGRVNDMAYSPDGNQLAVSTELGIWIYDARIGEELNALFGQKVVSSIAYSPDGRTLVSGGSKILLWDTATGEHKAPFTGPFAYANAVEFSPDGKTLATGAYENAHLWDAVTGELKASFRTKADNFVEKIAFSPDSKTLATESDGGTIRLWNVATATHKATLQGHTSQVISLTFSPDGKQLASSSDYTIRLWDTTTLSHKATLADPRIYYGAIGIAFSPDGRTLATGHGQDVVLWDVPSGQIRRTLIGHIDWVKNLAFSPDGRTIATGRSEIQLWDVASGKHKTIFVGHVGGGDINVAFSPDGRTLAANGSNRINLWDAVSGTPKTTLIGHTSEVSSVSFSPDGNTIASGSGDSTIRLWDVHTGNLETTLTGHTGAISSVAFSPDGNTIASGSYDHTVRLWDAHSGQHKATLTGHTGAISSVAFSPDGNTIASGSYDHTVRLWDAHSGQHQRTLIGHTQGVYSVAFSPDGNTIATGTLRELRLWNAATGKYKGGKKGFNSIVRFAFSPDGQTLASPTKNGGFQVMLWDVVTGVVKKTFPRARISFGSFSFSPGGQALAAVSGDFIFLWEVPPDILQSSGGTSAILPPPPLPAYPPQVRLIYFYPSDHTPQPNIDTELQTLAKETQDFYAQQMENHGFGRKTFQFETDANGKIVVHHLQGGTPAQDYISQSVYIMDELANLLDLTNHIYLVVLDPSLHGTLGTGICGLAWSGTAHGYGGAYQFGKNNRLAVVDCATVRITAHELGHTFGLSHDFRDDTYIMSHAAAPTRLSYAASEWLNVHPFLNPGQPKSDSENHTTIEILSSRPSQLQFRVADPDGLHQAQLILTENTTNNICKNNEFLRRFQTLNGTSDITLEFAATEISTEAKLWVIDRHGNISFNKFSIEPDSSVETIETDVNGDGTVNIQDLVQVAANLGATGENTADVNGDGVVNIQDLVQVAAQLGAGAAAPSAWRRNREVAPTKDEVEQWLIQAQALNLTDAISQRGIHFLEQLRAALTPKETALLPNYPNPFNPETWLPYQLAAPGDVTIEIHAIDGRLVRTLSLGHRAIGIYQSRTRAAYWDGRNQTGEPVASGVYFYTLSTESTRDSVTAGEFSATRKMLIRK